MVLAAAVASACVSAGGVAGRTTVPTVAALSPIYPIPTLTLQEKADLIEGRLYAQHLSPEGLLLYRVQLDDRSLDADIADAPSWLGFLISAQGLKLALKPSRMGQEQLRRSVGALALMFDLSGTDGLLVRSYVESGARLPWMVTQEQRPGRYWKPAAIPGWWVRTGPAKGHYAYAASGLAMVVGLQAKGDLVLDPDLSSLVSSTLISMVGHLRSCGYNVCEGGVRTEFGLLGEWFVDGFSGLALAGMLRAAARAGDEQSAVDLEAMVEMGLGGAIANTLIDRATVFAIKGPDKHSDTHQIYTSALSFWMNAGDDQVDVELLSDIRAGLRYVWTHERYSRKPWSIFVHQLVAGGVFPENATALETLRFFPDDLRRIEPYQAVEFEDQVVPIFAQKINTHYPKTSPFEGAILLPESRRTNIEHAGQDYLAQFYLGCWAGFIDCD